MEKTFKSFSETFYNYYKINSRYSKLDEQIKNRINPLNIIAQSELYINEYTEKIIELKKLIKVLTPIVNKSRPYLQYIDYISWEINTGKTEYTGKVIIREHIKSIEDVWKITKNIEEQLWFTIAKIIDRKF